MSIQQLLRLIRRPEVEKITGLKRSSLYSKMDAKSKQFDPLFPRPVSLSSSASGNGSKAWVESEVHEWVAHRIAISRRTESPISSA